MEAKVINLEEGMPTVDIGVKKLYLEIMTAKQQRRKVLKVIHGYGSSGVGGRLRKGVQKYLEEKKKEGFIKNYIPGEKWSIFNADTRSILDQDRDLRNDRDLERFNLGITIVLL
jgi:hypothetical protein